LHILELWNQWMP